ncbi:hypothetical protein BJ684DRAFT_14455 [Piptocephalis cylindrospora]|uniref:Uncharacterized protein n=1 Tax=Piptocephalis cylindrospora TaxID=1907219 RepID=A0A4P9Y8Y4_9FUNG|nr:hypothetical protein BJ684DRAFT_14455 [Piptocephalis cylindrospora]|eukprot:RKP15284.1 hypothetical protein BJ684DRAFT_14455 [Piptocephalis cylindrospora]
MRHSLSMILIGAYVLSTIAFVHGQGGQQQQDQTPNSTSDTLNHLSSTQQNGSNGNSNQQGSSNGNFNQQVITNNNSDQQDGSNGDSNQQGGSNSDSNQQVITNNNSDQQDGSNGDSNQQGGSNSDSNQQQDGSNGDSNQQGGSNSDSNQQVITNNNSDQQNGSNGNSNQQTIPGQTGTTQTLTPPGIRKSDNPLVLSVGTNYTLRATIPGTNGVQGYLCLNSTSLQLAKEPARDTYGLVLRNQTYPSCIVSVFSYKPRGSARTTLFFPYAPGDAFIFASDVGYMSAYQRKKKSLFSINLGLSMDLDIKGTMDAASIGTSTGENCIGIRERAPFFYGSTNVTIGTPLTMNSCDQMTNSSWAIEPVVQVVPDDNPDDRSNAGQPITIHPPGTQNSPQSHTSGTQSSSQASAKLSALTAAFSPLAQQGAAPAYMCASATEAQLSSGSAVAGNGYYTPILRDHLEASCVLSLDPSSRVENAFTMSFSADKDKTPFWYLGTNMISIQKNPPAMSQSIISSQDWYVNGTGKALTFASTSAPGVCLSVSPQAKHHKSEEVTGADATTVFSTVDCGDTKAQWTATFSPKVAGSA